MTASRQLAAIMFTDIVGYTALMGTDEQKAFELLKKNRQIHRPIIEKHQGRWLKEMGDGTLASFPSVSEAVYCAKEIQQTCLKENDLTLRIGIHLGEVVFEENDIFGDGVNIASRLEPLAPEGGIIVSESVQKNLLNKKEIQTIPAGEHRLKNIPAPIKIYQVVVEGLEVPESYYARSQSSRARLTKYGVIIAALVLLLALAYLLVLNKNAPFSVGRQSVEITDKSIAVLPFANMSNDPEQEYFSDGIAEEIINALVQIPDLKVSSRTSSFQFREEQDIKSIGDALGVATILDGSVRKSGNRVRVSAQLVNVYDGFHLWSQSYDRELNDIFVIQDELSQSIVDALQLKMSATSDKRLTENTTNMEAYNLHLQGRYFMHKRDRIGLDRSIDYFKQVIELDSLYAAVYADLANAYSLQGGWSYMHPDFIYPKAEAAAIKALEIDSKAGSALTALASVRLFYKPDFQEAEKLLNQAIDLNPNDSQAHHLQAFIYMITGKQTEAIEEIRKALTLDPLLIPLHFNLARITWWSGDLDEALSQALKTLEMDQNFIPVHRTLFHIYYWQNDWNNAIEHFAKWKGAYSEDAEIIQDTYKKLGWEAVANEIIPVLKERSSKEYISPMRFVEYYFFLKDLDSMMYSLEEAYNQNSPDIFMGIEPFYKPLHSNPRFQALLKKMGLPPASG